MAIFPPDKWGWLLCAASRKYLLFSFVNCIVHNDMLFGSQLYAENHHLSTHSILYIPFAPLLTDRQMQVGMDGKVK